jgi:hypothetical protein
LEEAGSVLDFNVGVSVLAVIGGPDFSTELMHHKLKSVTDAKHRYAQLEDPRVRGRRIGVIHRRWAARKNDSYRGIAADFFQAGGAGENHGKDILFTDAARDQLRILRTEVEDYDGLCFHGRVSQIARDL